MAHYAKVVSGQVQEVIVAEQDFIDTGVLGSGWIQTSYNTRGGVHYVVDTDTPSDDQTKALRKNFAGVGYTYDSVRDAFYEPQPYPSWILNETTCYWEAPIPKPTSYVNDTNANGNSHDITPEWRESDTSWITVDFSNQTHKWNATTLVWELET